MVPRHILRCCSGLSLFPHKFSLIDLIVWDVQTACSSSHRQSMYIMYIYIYVYNKIRQISIIPKPELRALGSYSLTKPPSGVTSADISYYFPHRESMERNWSRLKSLAKQSIMHHTYLSEYIYIYWVLPPPSNSDHKDYYMFSRGFLLTFTFHCYREGVISNIYIYKHINSFQIT